MKGNMLIMASLAWLLSSCQNQLVTNENTFPFDFTPRPLNEYVPKGECQRIELANGQVIYMDCDSTYFLSDMIFSKEQINAMNQAETKAAAIKSFVKYWSYTIPYYINSGFNNYQLNTIQQALSTIEGVTQIDFQQISSITYPCIIFTPMTGGNSSSVGKQSGGNFIYLNSVVFSKVDVMHELMHTLGFFHEHSRTDRDSYIIIHEDNIDPIYRDNFDVFTEYNGGSLGYNLGEFDYNSIMIYSSAMGATEQGYAITKLDGSPIYQGTKLSDKDIAGLNFLYGPKPVISTSIVTREDNGDEYSVDEYWKYSNVITFRNSENQQVSLTYPRLVVVEYHYTSQTGPNESNSVSFSEINYYVVPAGTTRYNLNYTERIRQEDMGINRYYQYEWYSVLVY